MLIERLLLKMHWRLTREEIERLKNIISIKHLESVNEIISKRKHQVVFITHRSSKSISLSYTFTQITSKDKKNPEYLWNSFFLEANMILTSKLDTRTVLKRKSLSTHLETLNCCPVSSVLLFFTIKNSYKISFNLGSCPPEHRQSFYASLAAIFSHGNNFWWMRYEWTWGGQFPGHLFIRPAHDSLTLFQLVKKWHDHLLKSWSAKKLNTEQTKLLCQPWNTQLL